MGMTIGKSGALTLLKTPMSRAVNWSLLVGLDGAGRK